MKPTIRICILLGCAAAAASLSSCRITQQTIDFSVFSDAVVPAQNDDVQVEAGSGLAASTATSSVAPVAPAAATSPTTPTSTRGSYTVLKGDTLSGIARKHSIPLSALYAANGLSESNSGIRDGQVLIIPATSAGVAAVATHGGQKSIPASPKTSSTGKRRYTVATGDTISSIARRHGVSSAALMQANGLTKETADKINIGQTLTIPAQHP